MRICDLKEEEIKAGMRVKSFVRELWGTIINIDPRDDNYAIVLWDDGHNSGFFGNDCRCEIDAAGTHEA